MCLDIQRFYSLDTLSKRPGWNNTFGNQKTPCRHVEPSVAFDKFSHETSSRQREDVASRQSWSDRIVEVDEFVGAFEFVSHENGSIRATYGRQSLKAQLDWNVLLGSLICELLKLKTSCIFWRHQIGDDKTTIHTKRYIFRKVHGIRSPGQWKNFLNRSSPTRPCALIPEWCWRKKNSTR